MNALFNVIRAISPFRGREEKEKEKKDGGSIRSGRSAASSSTRSGGSESKSDNTASDTRRKYKEAIAGSINGSSTNFSISHASINTGSNFDDSSTIASLSTAPIINRSISNPINRSNISTGRPPTYISNQNPNPNANYDNMVAQNAPVQNVLYTSRESHEDFDLSDVDLFKLLDMFYSIYNPSKRGTIEIVLNEYIGDEIELIEGLMRRYKVSNNEIEHFIGKCRILQGSPTFQQPNKNNHYYEDDDDDDDDDATRGTEISLPPSVSSDQEEEPVIIPQSKSVANSKTAAPSKHNSINGVRAPSRERGNSIDSEASVGLKDLLKISSRLDEENRTIADQMMALKLTEYDSHSPAQQISTDQRFSPADFTKANLRENPLIKVDGDKIIYDGVTLEKKGTVGSYYQEKSNSDPPQPPNSAGKGSHSKQFSKSLELESVNDADMENILASGFRPKNAQTFEKILNTPLYRQTSSAVRAAVKFKSAIKGSKGTGDSNKNENDENIENRSPNVDFRTGTKGERLKYDYTSMSATKKRFNNLNDMKLFFINWLKMRRASINKTKVSATLLNNKANTSQNSKTFLSRLREFVKDPTCVNKFQPYSGKITKRKEKRIWTNWIEKRKKMQKKAQKLAESNRHRKHQSLENSTTTSTRKALPISTIIIGANINSVSEKSKLSASGKLGSPVDLDSKHLVLNPLSKSNYKINRPQDELGEEAKKPVDLEYEKVAAEKELAKTISIGLQTKALLVESLCRGEALLDLLADILEKTKSNSMINAGQVIEKFLIKTGFPGKIFDTEDENIIGARLIAATKDSKFNKQCIRKHKGRFISSLYSEINEYNRNDFVTAESNQDNEESYSEGSRSDPESEDEQQNIIEEAKNMLAKKDLSMMKIEKSELFEFQNLNNHARLAMDAAPLFVMSKHSNQPNESGNASIDSYAMRSSSAGASAKKNGKITVSTTDSINNVSGTSHIISSDASTAKYNKIKSSISSTNKPAPIQSSFNPNISKSHTVDMDDLETISTVLKVNHDLPKYMAYTQGAVSRIVPDTKEVPQITSGGLLSPNKKTIEKIIIGKTPDKFKDNERNSRYLHVLNPNPNPKQITTSPPTISYPPTSPYHKPNPSDSNYADTMSLDLPDEVRQRISANFNSVNTNNEKEDATNGIDYKSSSIVKGQRHIDLAIPPARSVSRNRMSDFASNAGNSYYSASTRAGTGTGIGTGIGASERGGNTTLIDDWKAKLDPKTNRTYYYSPCRRVSTWDVVKYENRTGVDSVVSNSAANCSGSRVRPGSGSSSNSPAGSAYSTTVPPIKRGTLPSEEFKSTLGKRSTTPTGLRVNSPNKNDTTTVIDKNGESWVKKLDDVSNRFYWYCKMTKKSSWYPPV